MTKRRIEIITEVEREIFVIGRPIPIIFCETCDGETRMVTPEEAAAQLAVTARTIYRWVEAESVHYVETIEGILLICLDWLPQTPN